MVLEARRVHVLYAALLSIIILLAALAAYRLASSTARVEPSSAAGTAASTGVGPRPRPGAPRSPCNYTILYYDPLARDYPNKTLVKLLQRIAKRYNACIDILLGEKAGVKAFFETRSADIVVIRAHGGIWGGHGFYIATGLLASEKLDVSEDLARRLAEEKVLAVASPAVLVGSGALVDKKYVILGSPRLPRIVGVKRGSVWIVMSCSSAQDDAFVNAVLSSGAQAYIGWVGTVKPRDIDRLLPRLLNETLAALHKGLHGCKLGVVIQRLGSMIFAQDTHAILTLVCRG